MIFCKFCGGKSQKQYLYLNCKHLSCLSCSFLRADFSSQEIECCDINTKIDQNSMEMIIKSKRFTRNQFEGNDNRYNYAPPIKDQKTQTLKEQNKIEQNASQKPIQRSKMSENKENLVIVSQNLQNNKQKDYQDEQQNEFGNILLKNLEQLKRYFQAQRMLLKQRQEAAIKDIVSFYTIQKQSITRPVSQKNLDKLHTLLSTKVSSVGLKNKNLNPQNVIKNTHQPKEPKQLKQTKQSHESYDHILKRLEVNQQRMKQKIQRHLQVLY